MTGLIKMYAYRMFRKKGIYITITACLGMMYLSLSMLEKKNFSNLIEQSGELMIMIPAVYAAIFFSADNSSGFIKNYAGAVPDRSNVIIARGAIVLIMNIITAFFIAVGGLIMTNSTGNGRFAVTYLGCMLLSGIGTSMLAVLFCELIRKSVPTIIVSVLVFSGIAGQLFGTVFALVTKGRFILTDFIITGMLKLFGSTRETGDARRLIIVASAYIIAALAASIFSIKKRDAA